MPSDVEIANRQRVLDDHRVCVFETYDLPDEHNRTRFAILRWDDNFHLGPQLRAQHFHAELETYIDNEHRRHPRGKIWLCRFVHGCVVYNGLCDAPAVTRKAKRKNTHGKAH